MSAAKFDDSEADVAIDVGADVAIIGGGPAGSTCGALLRKYHPLLRVVILEKEAFPREHVGESQLPLISHILDEMGAWDKVEAAGFPVKLGATYRWGRSTKLWDFGFMPVEEFRDEPRPGKFVGQRRRLAFQVDRAVYDQILLDHAASMGCQVRQGTAVRRVLADGDRVQGLELASGEVVRARYYVDASGVVGLVREAVGVGISYPTPLKNVAFWDYWENAEWAVRVGSGGGGGGGGTRVLVMSIGCGWLWFIPISATRTSIGVVCPAAHYKSTGQSPEELYLWAIQQEPLLRELTAHARREGQVRATRDWSSLSDRASGENWFLAGDAAGFGDPILAAGLMLTHASAREAAYTILELDRLDASDAPIQAEVPLDRAWLLRRYDESVRNRVRQHIRFAEYWYCANGIFTDLEDHTRTMARDVGLDLDPQKAFQWLANGGFTNDVLGRAGMGGVDFNMVMMLTGELTGLKDWRLSQFNRFVLQLQNAREEDLPLLLNGRIRRERCLVRGDKMLPIAGIYAVLIKILSEVSMIQEIRGEVVAYLAARRGGGGGGASEHEVMEIMQGLEVMLLDGWVFGEYIPGFTRYRIQRASDDATRMSCVPDAGSAAPRTMPARPV